MNIMKFAISLIRKTCSFSRHIFKTIAKESVLGTGWLIFFTDFHSYYCSLEASLSVDVPQDIYT